MNYALEIENAVHKNLLNANDIFDFRETPFEELYQNYYQFCRENLDIHSAKLNIAPNVFAFKNGFASNAEAKRTPANDFGIFVNIGLMRHCNEHLLTNERLDAYFSEKFPEMIQYFDISISKLAFQIATQFTYYHELAHLIQFSKKVGESSLQERDANCNIYDETKHILEINADTYASIAITSHIQQYMEKSLGENISQQLVENTIVTLSSCLLNYITSFSDDFKNIYFKLYYHPHPILRLFNVILNITHHISNGSVLTEKNIKVDSKKLFKEVLDLYKVLEENKVFETNFTETLDAAFIVRNQITEYLGDLIQFKTDEYFDAMEKWNDLLT